LSSEWPSDRLEVLVIDNASTDGSGQIAAELGVDVLRTESNLGFGANNLGLKSPPGQPEPEVFVLLNDDVAVDPGWLAPLVSGLDGATHIGAVQPTLVFDQRYGSLRIEGQPGATLGRVFVDGSEVTDRVQPVVGMSARAKGSKDRALESTALAWVPLDAEGASVTAEVDGRNLVMGHGPPEVIAQNAGVTLTAEGYGADRDSWVPSADLGREPHQIFGFCGGAVALSREFIEDVGGLYEPLFLYYEDLDWAWRGRMRGWTYQHQPASVVRHKHSATVGVGSALHRHWTTRNRLVVFARCAPRGLLCRAWSQELRGLAWHIRHRDPEEYRWRAKALFSALRATPRAFKDRRGIRGTRSMSSETQRTDALVKSLLAGGGC
jgi:GT2 family glycosyltransferase